MNLEDFKTEVEEAAQLYLSDYPRSFFIDYDLDDPETPRAEITLTMSDESQWILQVTLDEYGEIGLEAGGETFLPLNGEAIYATLWLEAMDRLAEARSAAQ